jgi:hypothetical protein
LLRRLEEGGASLEIFGRWFKERERWDDYMRYWAGNQQDKYWDSTMVRCLLMIKTCAVTLLLKLYGWDAKYTDWYKEPELDDKIKWILACIRSISKGIKKGALKFQSPFFNNSILTNSIFLVFIIWNHKLDNTYLSNFTYCSVVVYFSKILSGARSELRCLHIL